MRNSLRVIALGVVLSVGSAPLTTAGAQPAEPPAKAYLEAVLESNPEDAATPALRALDAGHDLEQVVDAAGEGQLAPDGTVTDDSGPVEPAGPPVGVLATVDDAALLKAINRTEDRLADRKASDAYLEANILMLILIFDLASKGYTVEQIVGDGLFGGGRIECCGLVSTLIVDKQGKPLKPGGEPAEPVLGGFVDDMLDYAQGHDPLNPKYEPQFRVTYRGELKVGETLAKVTAKGRIGTAEGRCCFGELRGKVVTPPEDCTGGETIPLKVAINGSADDTGGRVELEQDWVVSDPIQSSYDPSADTSGEFCLSARDLAEGSFPFLGDLLGPLRGFVAVDETLKSVSAQAGTMRLSIDEKL